MTPSPRVGGVGGGVAGFHYAPSPGSLAAPSTLLRAAQAVFWYMLGVVLPAVHHHRTGVGRCGSFHPPDEGQQPGGVIGHPVVGPGREVELTHLMLGRVSPLSRYTLCVRCKLLHSDAS